MDIRIMKLWLTKESIKNNLLEAITKELLNRFITETGKPLSFYYYTFTGSEYEEELICIVATNDERKEIFFTVPREKAEEAAICFILLNKHLKFKPGLVLGCNSDDFIHDRITIKITAEKINLENIF